MFNFSHTIKTFRHTAGLSTSELASLLQLTEEELGHLEQGQPVPLDIISRCALIAGRELVDFVKAPESATSPTLFFKALPDRVNNLEELTNTGTHLVLGELARRAQRITKLRQMLKSAHDPSWLEDWEAPKETPSSPELLWQQAQEQSERLRTLWGLGLEPIRSLQSLLKRHHVSTVYLTPDELTPTIEGISLRAPLPMLVVNLIYGADTIWHMRMTLAHELGHLLMDLNEEVSTLVSPHANQQTAKFSKGWRVAHDLEDLERRANAFAASFLAPAKAVRALIKADNPTSKESVIKVGQHFGLGKQSAINIITNTFGLTKEMRRALDGQHITWDKTSHIEEDFNPGMYRGELEELTLMALQKNIIGKVQAHQLLNLSLSDELPQGSDLNEQQQGPLISQARVALSEATHQVQEMYDASYFVGDATRQAHQWWFEVFKMRSRTEAQRVGTATLSITTNKLSVSIEP